MPGPRLIDDYLAALSVDLPGRIVDELSDGLDETYHRHLGQSHDPETAARAAVAEFGEPRVIVAAFTDASRGRKTARRLLAAGPVVGLCWAACSSPPGHGRGQSRWWPGCCSGPR
jgi:hypothetical protein